MDVRMWAICAVYAIAYTSKCQKHEAEILLLASLLKRHMLTQ